MGNDLYSNFLATRIVHGQEAITYRLLSRELKIHTALAKRYLYVFYASSRSLYPHKVHATYLISGQKSSSTTISGDVRMSDISSPPSTPPDADVVLEDEIIQTTFELVPEEELEEAKYRFRKIGCVHVYSLEPTRLPEDFITLAECGRKVREIDLDQDPEAISKTYGVVSEPSAKRQQLGQVAFSQPKLAAKNVQPKAKVPHPKPEINQGLSLSTKQRAVSKPSNMLSPLLLDVTQNPDRSTTTEDKTSSDNIKKERLESLPDKKTTSSVMKVDATRSAVIKKSKSTTPTSRSSSQVSQELQTMFSSSEDENDDDEEEKSITAKTETPKDVIGAIHESFISDDIDLSIDKTPAKPKGNNVKSEDIEMETAPPLEEPGEEIADISPKKRRGRRKVTKPIHTKDANGFLTTKYEEVWESYSESDGETISLSKPASTRSSTPTKRSSSPAPKKDKDVAGKKENGRKKKQTGGGQSSLMSFWNK
ncbi:DNA polymerase subunit Cdc27 [Lipomyces chichibuensis]|uniref:DNA polymerase subunit Cdc27 n=1 Tax=Lipomyces chichibuensis TaxID=1546026 RepID=UPI0033434AA3